MDPASAFHDCFQEGEAPSDVIIVCRSRIHDQMAVSVAVAVDCALRLRTFAQKFLISTKKKVLKVQSGLYGTDAALVRNSAVLVRNSIFTD